MFNKKPETMPLSKPFRNWAFPAIVLFTSSCFSYLQIPVNYSPEIELKENEKSIQYISFYDPSQLDFENEKRIEVYASGAEKIKEGLKNSFQTNHDFTFLPMDSVVRGYAYAYYSDTLPPGMVRRYCSLNNSSMLLALEAFNVSYDKRSEETTNDEGKKKNVVHYILITEACLTLYDNTGRLINRSNMEEEKYIDTRDALFLDIAIRPSFANKQKEVDQMSYKIGSNYISKFYPKTVSEQRKYYTGKDFTEITPYLKSQQWEKAIELLLPMSESSDPKIAMKASHNLGVAFEGLENYERADYWYAKSDELNGGMSH